MANIIKFGGGSGTKIYVNNEKVKFKSLSMTRSNVQGSTLTGYGDTFNVINSSKAKNTFYVITISDVNSGSMVATVTLKKIQFSTSFSTSTLGTWTISSGNNSTFALLGAIYDEDNKLLYMCTNHYGKKVFGTETGWNNASYVINVSNGNITGIDAYSMNTVPNLRWDAGAVIGNYVYVWKTATKKLYRYPKSSFYNQGSGTNIATPYDNMANTGFTLDRENRYLYMHNLKETTLYRANYDEQGIIGSFTCVSTNITYTPEIAPRNASASISEGKYIFATSAALVSVDLNSGVASLIQTFSSPYPKGFVLINNSLTKFEFVILSSDSKLIAYKPQFSVVSYIE